MDMRANGVSMEGANSFTLELFSEVQNMQKEMMQQLSVNMQEITARNQAMQASGKGNKLNISV